MRWMNLSVARIVHYLIRGTMKKSSAETEESHRYMLSLIGTALMENGKTN